MGGTFRAEKNKNHFVTEECIHHAKITHYYTKKGMKMQWSS